MLGAGGDLVLPSMQPYNIFDDDARLLQIFDKIKRECMENRWLWEREWLRDIYYTSGRQWITYHPTKREWVDKRLHKWIPKPTTNKMAETVQAIRTTFGAIDLTVKVRPIGNDNKSISAAEIADLIGPLIEDEHEMNQVMREADFWLIVTGSVMLQVSWDRDKRFNSKFIQFEQCTQCMNIHAPKDIVAAQNTCIHCGGNQFIPATNPDGSPMGEDISFGRGKTAALSPFEYAFPSHCTKFSEIPYILRMRWRERSYYEANYPPEVVAKLSWEKSPTDRSMQLFKALATSSDLGSGNNFQTLGTSSSPQGEGMVEYELWIQPTPDFQQGAVIRVVNEKSPMLLRKPDEAIPGPFPYKDIEGKVIFPFAFAQYEHVGGRLYGRSALAPVIQKQDQLNQIDSLVQLIAQRMANPIWVIPEGAGIDQFSGEPGFVMKWNPLQVGGAQAKPERIAGSEIPHSLMAMREQVLSDIENLTGTYDIIKGQKPQGVEAFSALQLLVERSQSRFQSVFASRGEMFRRWFEIALELERQYGPDERVMTIVGPNKTYAFEHFTNAQLQGEVQVRVEDGANMPKTALGKRAAIEQANQLGLLDPTDPDQRYVLLHQFGLQDISPRLNTHVQAALQMQDDFEKWMASPESQMAQPQISVDPMTGQQIMLPPQTPLIVRDWLDPQIHFSERVKWLNTDKMRLAMQQNPMIEQIVQMHLQELQMTMMPPMPVGPDGQPAPGGGGMAMANSNQNSGAISSLPSGNNPGPNMGPA